MTLVGLVLSPLVHPWFYVMVAVEIGSGRLLAPSLTWLEAALFALGVVNVVLGYSVAIVLGILTVIRRRRAWLLAEAQLIPLYWLLISVAAYRALKELIEAPHFWCKTKHSGRKGSRASQSAAGPSGNTGPVASQPVPLRPGLAA